MPSRRTIAVIGGGSAGVSAAFAARDAGARVVLFLGATAEHASLCIDAGCMPSKALFEPLDAMHRARLQGWNPQWRRGSEILEQVVRRKEREIARFRAFRHHELRSRAGDDLLLVEAPARMVEPHVVEGGGTRWTVDAIVLATGSERLTPDIEGWEDVAAHAWSNEEILDNTELPDSLAVVGAGAIGMQFSLRYARLGCQVTIVTDGDVLPRYPRSFGRRLADIYEREGLRVLTRRRVERVRRDCAGWFVLETEGEDGFEPIVAERMLVAIGRRPALRGLGLDVLGLEPDGSGLLPVAQDLRVRGVDHVFAAGDVVGCRMTVHEANLEASLAGRNAATSDSKTWDRRASLKVVYTDPELAIAGIDEGLARRSGHEAVTATKESRFVGKLHLAGDDSGFGEFVADARDGRLLGAGLLCDDASILIHVPAYAIQHGHTVEQALEAEYYHPTKMGIVQGILEQLREACRQ